MEIPNFELLCPWKFSGFRRHNMWIEPDATGIGVPVFLSKLFQHGEIIEIDVQSK